MDLGRAYNLIDETGNRHRALTVRARAGNDPKNGCATWLCQCDCGKLVEVRGQNLRSGKTNSCGCGAHRGLEIIREPREESAFNQLYGDMKRRAEAGKREWDITKSELRLLTKYECYYCGTEPYQKQKLRGSGLYIYNGLDRVDNDKGYTWDNVVPCCGECNVAKHIHNQDRFFARIKRIYERHDLEDAEEQDNGIR